MDQKHIESMVDIATGNTIVNMSRQVDVMSMAANEIMLAVTAKIVKDIESAKSLPEYLKQLRIATGKPVAP